MEQITGIIPVLVISAMILFPKDFIIFSGTILGKCLAFSAIVWATTNDWVYGVFVCSLVVYYYNLDIVQSVLGYHIWEFGYEGFVSSPSATTEDVEKEIDKTPKYSPYSIFDTFADFTYKPAELEPDAETKLEKVEIHDVVAKYLQRTNKSSDDTKPSERDRMLELEAKMRLPEQSDDWMAMMAGHVTDTVVGWGTTILGVSYI